MTVFTALFGQYEQLKQPQIYTKGWNYVCFTDQPFESNIWEVRNVFSHDNPRFRAREVKILFHEYIDDPFSIWLDGSFIINCNLNEFWEKHFETPFSAPIHPTRTCIYDEIKTAISSRRGGTDRIKEQLEHYKAIGIPERQGLISSGIILRENTIECREFCNEWWQETLNWSLRDQVSFAKVSINNPNIHTFKYDYRFRKEFIYVHHNHKMNRFAKAAGGETVNAAPMKV